MSGSPEGAAHRAAPRGSSGHRPELGPGAEFDLIRRFLAGGGRGASGEVAVGPGDDCAVLAGNGIALSVDLSVEGVHFRREWLTPYEIGHRAAMAALSDLAAMAARPIGVLAAIAVPEADAGEFAAELMRGAGDAAARVGAIVLGGDLARSPSGAVVDIVAVGEAPAPVLRGGARPGDEIWVTGELGGAALAVDLLLAGEPTPPDLFERFARPAPRVREAIWLRDRGALTAMLDLSDGLAGDAAHIAAASGVALVLERDAIPVHPAVLASVDRAAALAYAASGGEDYELCFCAAPGRVGLLAAEFASEFPVRLTRIGTVEEGDGVFWRAADQGRERASRGGFQHFGDPG